jgi:hypothetical protein
MVLDFLLDRDDIRYMKTALQFAADLVAAWEATGNKSHLALAAMLADAVKERDAQVKTAQDMDD